MGSVHSVQDRVNRVHPGEGLNWVPGLAIGVGMCRLGGIWGLCPFWIRAWSDEKCLGVGAAVDR
jgi:hypothetical protein